MITTNLKRSLATLGVVAGFLVAAVPASAMNGQEGDDTLVKAPKPSAATEVPTSEVFELNLMGGDDTLDARTNPSFAVDMGSSEK